MNRAFRYSGNKQHLVKYINSILPEDSKDRLYLECFLGSGAIFYNLNQKFKWSFLTDLDQNIINLHENFINFNYSDYQNILKEVETNFGNIKTSKEAYYLFRNNYNLDKGNFKNLKLLLLTNSCINSMLRFGPNGMNQSYGARHFIISEKSWNDIKQRLFKATLKCRSYINSFEMIKSNKKLKYFLFLDPPYADREMTYNKGFNRKTFITNLKELIHFNIKIVYSDIENLESDELLNVGFTKVDSKMLRNTCPSSNKSFTKKEVLYLFNV